MLHYYCQHLNFSQWYHSKNSVKHSEMKIKPKYLNGYNVSLTWNKVNS